MATSSPQKAAKHTTDRVILQDLSVLGRISKNDLLWVDEETGDVTLHEYSVIRGMTRAWCGQDRDKTASRVKVIVEGATERYEELARSTPESASQDAVMRLAQHTSNMKDALTQAAKGIKTLAAHYDEEKKGSNAYISLDKDARSIEEALLRVSMLQTSRFTSAVAASATRTSMSTSAIISPTVEGAEAGLSPIEAASSQQHPAGQHPREGHHLQSAWGRRSSRLSEYESE